MSNEMKELEVVKKNCRTAKKVVSVVRVLVIVGMVLSILGAVICFAMNDKICQEALTNPNVTVSINDRMGLLSTTTTADDLVDNNVFGYYAGACALLGALGCLFVTIVLNSIIKSFNIILDEGTPFSETITKKLKVCFILIVILSAYAMGLGFALFIAMFFWCIHSIFKYGCELQKQSDETL